MKATSNLILGEVFAIEKHLYLPFMKMYSKRFYDNKFITKLGRTMMHKHPIYDVSVSETNDDYILNINFKEDE